jgi:chemotaxis family two-component system sensor kinase Cph1
MAPDFPLPPGELQRLAECVLEPIRYPGAVQPHGAVLVVTDDAAMTITHVSENTDTIVGADPMALLGRSLRDVLDATTIETLLAVLADDAGNPMLATIGDRKFDVIVHRTGTSILVEFEPFTETPQEMILGTRAALRRFGAVRSVNELFALTATEVRRITGFDRVMVYHFYPDQHGEVVAEAVASDMEPYLGLHYPASDIPAQARELYITKLSRLIASSTKPGVTFLADANREHPESIDLSGAELRAVSPHHLEFMRNMGQASTFSLSLVRNGVLVGMITCAHRTERRLPYNIRDGLEILANQVSLQLGAMRDIEQLALRNEVRELRSALVSQLTRSDDLMDALLHQHITLLDLIPSEGAVIRLGDRVGSIGTVPDRSVLQELIPRLQAAGAPTDLVTDSLELEHPDVAAILPDVAGVLVRPLGIDGDYLAWFRGERTRTVDWLGDMSPENRLTPLSPRNSFSSWSQEVGGTSLPWQGLEREARELARDLQSTLLHRAESRLADLALQDPLTGLPNRRLLMDRLQHELTRIARGDELAVLFIDLDEFKRINDTYGHSAGDAALQHTASALRRASRAEDTVARLGGDEFVVLAAGLGDEEAHKLAARILEAISGTPVTEEGWSVSASIGVAIADHAADASHVLSAADAAMYRAKLAGKHRFSD